MGFADRMMRAENRTLHKAETTLGSVDMHETAKADIFIGGMVHGAMVCVFLADLLIRREFVSHTVRMRVNNYNAVAWQFTLAETGGTPNAKIALIRRNRNHARDDRGGSQVDFWRDIGLPPSQWFRVEFWLSRWRHEMSYRRESTSVITACFLGSFFA